ncbi:hypothetical protein G6F24_014483 [Rhizopus arrhizus]|nr:hypothetical protein G6F24_014483 [Rhizopus arrhizus]
MARPALCAGRPFARPALPAAAHVAGERCAGGRNPRWRRADRRHGFPVDDHRAVAGRRPAAGAADRAGRAAATATGRRQPAPAAWPHHRRRAAGQQWRPGALSAAPAAVAGVPVAAGGQLRLPRQDRGRDRRGPVRRLQRAGTGLALVAG